MRQIVLYACALQMLTVLGTVYCFWHYKTFGGKLIRVLLNLYVGAVIIVWLLIMTILLRLTERM